jgi:hypothetical protein
MAEYTAWYGGEQHDEKGLKNQVDEDAELLEDAGVDFERVDDAGRDLLGHSTYDNDVSVAFVFDSLEEAEAARSAAALIVTDKDGEVIA